MIRTTAPIDPVDYLLIGHITQDIIQQDSVLGGTATYSALTAKALGMRVGIVTSCAKDLDLSPLNGIAVASLNSEFTTTYENIESVSGRIQFVQHQASFLDASIIPETWRNTPIVHLGPVDQEIDPNIVHLFPDSFIGITPQGWLREWDHSGKVHVSDWPEARYVLENVSAAVLSIEDIGADYKRVEDMLTSIRVLVVTEGAEGDCLYWNGDARYFRPHQKYQGDSTGAGDIFASAFFIRLSQTKDPWEAARFATQLAAYSVKRPGLEGIPTPEEIKDEMIEIISK